MRRLFLIAMLLVAAACSRSPSAPRNTDWALLGNSPEMQHHSDLAEINKANVSKLDLAWWVQMPLRSGLVGNPLIQNGIVFQSGPNGQIFANDVRTGKLLWNFNPEFHYVGAQHPAFLSSLGNRGLALWKDKVIVASGDCRLYAVDQKTGKKIWEAQSCDSTKLYGITAAPRVGEGLVFTGNNCMDSGQGRGYIDALDADTGKRRWRFYTVPGDPSKPQDSPLYDMAAKTWGTNWYKKTQGCGSDWDAITYDPKLHQVYIGVDGPSPFDPSLRAPDAGDELFTTSIVALDARTGAYKWHFKETPNDGWNYDACVGIMVADVPVNGKTRRTVVSTPKNGFAYVLDAETGKFISGGAYVPVTWAKGLDANGRPIVDSTGRYWLHPDGTALVEPNPMGAHGWEATAFDPKTNILYIPAMIMPAKMTSARGAAATEGIDWFYGGDSGDPKLKTSGEVVAWDLTTSSAKWRTRTSDLPMNGGLMHTSGGLVFQGQADGRLVAFDDTTGQVLWSRQTGGAIVAAPSTVMVDGEQYVIVATGNGASAVSGNITAKYNSTPATRTPPRLLAFRIGGKSAYPPLANLGPARMPPEPRLNAELAAKGQVAYRNCATCHGQNAIDAVDGKAPNLFKLLPNLDLMKMVVLKGALASAGMPPQPKLTEADVAAIHAYLINGAWDVYDKDRTKSVPKDK